ncbi:MAG: hypothetical protein ABIO88_04970, partial [Burkholderiaceae bacterium]
RSAISISPSHFSVKTLCDVAPEAGALDLLFRFLAGTSSAFLAGTLLGDIADVRALGGRASATGSAAMLSFADGIDISGIVLWRIIVGPILIDVAEPQRRPVVELGVGLRQP